MAASVTSEVTAAVAVGVALEAAMKMGGTQEKSSTQNTRKKVSRFPNNYDLPPSSSLSWLRSEAELSSTDMKLAGLEAGLVTDRLLVRTAASDDIIARVRCNSFRSRSRSSSRSCIISYD